MGQLPINLHLLRHCQVQCSVQLRDYHIERKEHLPVLLRVPVHQGARPLLAGPGSGQHHLAVRLPPKIEPAQQPGRRRACLPDRLHMGPDD